jgi:hypothetical protein
MAERGDVAGLFQHLTACPRSWIDYPEVLPLLLKAVEVRATQQPAGFTDDLFHRILTFSTFLLLRCHLYAAKILDRQDCELQQRGSWEPSAALEGVMPHLLQLQQHLVEIMQAQATVQRLRELTRQKSLENQRLMNSSRKPLKSQSDPVAKQRRGTAGSNGKVPVNRLAGLVDFPLG